MSVPVPAVERRGPHPVVLREVTVARTTRLTPRMQRVTLTGEQLAGFTSEAADDHVALFFLRDDQQVPVSTEPGRRPIWQERPPTRDYTPRRFDAERLELDIDFVLHGAGVASTWAESAEPGTRIALGGPRTSVVATGFEHYLLVGDESALPAVARRVEELPAGAHATVVVEVPDATEEQPLANPNGATIDVRWVHRGAAAPGDPTLLGAAVAGTALPETSLFAVVAAETDVVRALRHHLLAERGLEPATTRTGGYWKRSAR